MTPLRRSTLFFMAIGLLIYGGVYYASERLLYRTGDTNPFFKIETAEHEVYDWVILGASHAMPLDFADFNAHMEQKTGLRILNLASPGVGPLYNRFVFEYFLLKHQTANLLYIIDSFAFYSRSWNEARFADAKLIGRTPFRPELARRFWEYSIAESIDPRAALAYVTGFAKINNRERFKRDIWEGEDQFDRTYRPSTSATRKRIAYLYPDDTPDRAALARYLQKFAAFIDTAQRTGIAVFVIKMPVPAQFYRLLPNEAAFDEALSGVLAEREVPIRDFSPTMDESRFYFDTDHLNRLGLTQFFDRHLRVIFAGK